MFKINIDAVRGQKKAQIDEWRVAAEQAGMVYAFPSGQSDVVQLRDDRDRANINGQVTTAMLLQSQGIDAPVLPFRAESNTTYMLTPAQMIALGVATGQFSSQQYQIGWTLKEQVDAATTVQQLEAITWPQSSTN